MEISQVETNSLTAVCNQVDNQNESETMLININEGCCQSNTTTSIVSDSNQVDNQNKPETLAMDIIEEDCQSSSTTSNVSDCKQLDNPNEPETILININKEDCQYNTTTLNVSDCNQVDNPNEPETLVINEEDCQSNSTTLNVCDNRLKSQKHKLQYEDEVKNCKKQRLMTRNVKDNNGSLNNHTDKAAYEKKYTKLVFKEKPYDKHVDLQMKSRRSSLNKYYNHSEDREKHKRRRTGELSHQQKERYKIGEIKNSKFSQERKNRYETGDDKTLQNMLLPRENAIHFKHELNPMSIRRLQTLVTKTTSEILLTIVNKESGFCMLLDQEINRNVMAYILLALGKAVDCYMNTNVSEMILSVTSNSNFFLVKLQHYLVSFRMQKPEVIHLSSLLSLAEFLHKFQITLPSNAADVVLILLPLLKQTCEKYLKDNKELCCSVSQKLEEIEEQNNMVLKKFNAIEIKQASKKEKMHLMKPPEDYRSIPILPTAGDILEGCSFLRPNLVMGKYQDTNDYLDVQYRLLREDYVRPLRDGISEYLKVKRQGKSLRHCKNVRVYPNVQIVKEEFVNGGLVHMAQFNDRNFSKIKWDYSKRFLSGSLLCFSSDDFKTMLFASVANRETKELNKGLLLVHFEEMTDEVLNISPSINFVVVETSAYFEAYRHNLKALHELNEANLPMKQYIIETQKNTQKPLYLSESTTYDMRPLLFPLNSESVEDAMNSLHTKISEKTKNVNILDENCWPTAEELMLDPSQYAAFRAAITQEFAIIQGPPGTGKTYVGLKIAQVLLNNIEKWCSDSKQLPILVICYTNHALDQFLEGLLMFTKKLVRVGGRGKNETISQYQLNNLKKAIKLKRTVPHYIFSNMKAKHSQLRGMRRDIDNIQKSSAKCFKSILKVNELMKYMSLEHIDFLGYWNCLGDDEFLMNDWLEIRNRDENARVDHFQNNYRQSQCDTEQVLQQLQRYTVVDTWEENEADIEYIENERLINPEEFQDASYDFPNYQEDAEHGRHSKGERKRQAEREELQRYIESRLKNTYAMSKYEADSVRDIWYLDIENRWRLYKFWLECYLEGKEKEFFELQQELCKEFEQLKEMRTEEDIYVCKQAHVVGMTTTGASKYRHIVQQLNPKIVIVEEAAEILESHIVTSLAPGTQHVILIGDHQQLRPSPTVHLLAVKYDLNVSLFERMVKNGMECHRLSIQHRMRTEIAALISPHIYDNLQNHKSVTKYENIKGVSKNVFFVSHTYKELQESDSKSKVNQHEAKFLINLCKYFINQGYSSSQITVLTTYSGQLFEMKRLNAQGGILSGVKFTVVDNYQGEENDIVLISFVRSNEDGEIGFLKVANRVCVALSRAKKGLFCIGNFQLLAEKSDLWKNIVEQLEKDNAIGPLLQLACQNHPEVSNAVGSAEDFNSVPEGGCSKKCDFRLSCGHVCQLMCHPHDREHEEVTCYKPCKKTCDVGHVCKKKCCQECDPCQVIITKAFESCRHTIEIQCHKKKEKIHCKELCDKYLDCGHMCTKQCWRPCVLKCVEKVQVKSILCGHKVIIECFDFENRETLAKVCREPCRKELSCGHMCQGTCGTCHQGRLHMACRQPCKRILVCGHECRSVCSKSCPPCERHCENRCIHSRCPKTCGEPCGKCNEPCPWSCAHKKCSRVCGEQCDRTPCDEPCLKLLKCKHPCIGLCGEPCPKYCRICHEDKVKEIFFGFEDEEGARFIKLEDCKHIFELNGLTQWINHDMNEKREIQMKTCPKCKVVIRRNLHFGNVVKSCLEDIEKVKRLSYGNVSQNRQSQEALLLRVKESGKLSKFSLHCRPLIDILSSTKIRLSTQKITIMENIVTILLSLLSIVPSCSLRIKKRQLGHSLSEPLAVQLSNTSIEDSLTKLQAYIENTTKWLTTFIGKKCCTASEEQLQELSWEADRLKLASTLVEFLKNESNVKPASPLNSLLESVMSDVPFREAEKKKFISDFESYRKLIGGAQINVTELEKHSILKAMGLSKGHWYQCPNGHVYCITECGGAMQESKCNECGENIGGAQHRILSTNRVATAMDGARHSAWSDTRNMENYQFD
ncbi:hypothetical protein JTE90_008817 [Oedothorax gibbosus]|uniref:RZ-type domain-containing protein n=1 Tax=Oedothorax gibbosus TaxID=931172 RepID=A0AAV6V748_9ARAC|nr:hypothetical protein JTE90_008817 [Oedothorax gibbosus]